MTPPPMFPQPVFATEAQEFLHRARMFRKAAISLPAYDNGGQVWPAYFLVFHSIELALKAFAKHAEAAGAKKAQRASNHDLLGLYNRAVGYGHWTRPGDNERMSIVSEAHLGNEARYPAGRQIGDVLSIADDLADHIIPACAEHLSAPRRN